MRIPGEGISLSIIRSGVTAAFNQELEQTHAEYLEAGLGREITSVTDDRFLGVVLRVLLEKLTGEVFTDAASLAGAIRDALNTMYEGQTVFGRIEEGGLGAKAYRKARFLKDSKDDAFVINWARTFIKEHYPATLSKRGSRYSLVHDKRAPLLIESYKCWLSRYVDGELPELDLCFEEIRPETELREQVQARRKAGGYIQNDSSRIGCRSDKSETVVSGHQPRQRDGARNSCGKTCGKGCPHPKSTRP